MTNKTRNNKHFNQPFGLDHVANTFFNDTFYEKDASMYIYEIKPETVKGTIPVAFIPSSYNEWIIGYNSNNSKSAFICIGSVTGYTEYNIPAFENYFGVRFDGTGMYFNNGTKAYPAEILGKFFSYTPEKDSYEYMLIESFKASLSLKDKVRVFSQFLEQSKTFTETSDTLKHLTGIIRNNKGNVTVYTLARELGYSERQINRIFKEAYGYGPKDYCKFIRFQNVLSEISKNPLRENSQFILNTGYADQAHFQREFKAFTHITPKQYISRLI